MQNTQKGIDYTTSIVKSGDSLYAIAQLFGSNVDTIKNTNNLASNTIYPNQILFIPRNKMITNNMYQTVEGDTLATVFRKLNLDTKCLKCYSPLMNVLLLPNQLIEVVDNKKPMGNKTITYMGEDIEEFLMNNEIDAMGLIKSNNWLTPGSRIRLG